MQVVGAVLAAIWKVRQRVILILFLLADNAGGNQVCAIPVEWRGHDASLGSNQRKSEIDHIAVRAVDRCVQLLRGNVVLLSENPRFGATETAAMG